MNEWPRAVSTAAVWVAIGFALGAGLFKMNFTGVIALPILLLLPFLLVGGAVIATWAIWRRASSSKEDDIPR
jgi:membrane protein DedA with SNARE-associated domain